MAERLAGGDNGIALLANAIATGAALYPLILSFDGVSGAHFNPAVGLVMGINRELRWSLVGSYALVQTIGAILGVWIAHLMFDVPIWQTSPKLRTGRRPVARSATLSHAARQRDFNRTAGARGLHE